MKSYKGFIIIAAIFIALLSYASPIYADSIPEKIQQTADGTYNVINSCIKGSAAEDVVDCLLGGFNLTAGTGGIELTPTQKGVIGALASSWGLATACVSAGAIAGGATAVTGPFAALGAFAGCAGALWGASHTGLSLTPQQPDMGGCNNYYAQRDGSYNGKQGASGGACPAALTGSFPGGASCNCYSDGSVCCFNTGETMDAPDELTQAWQQMLTKPYIPDDAGADPDLDGNTIGNAGGGDDGYGALNDGSNDNTIGNAGGGDDGSGALSDGSDQKKKNCKDGDTQCQNQNNGTDPSGIMALTGNHAGEISPQDMKALGTQSFMDAFGGEPASTDTTIGAGGQ